MSTNLYVLETRRHSDRTPKQARCGSCLPRDGRRLPSRLGLRQQQRNHRNRQCAFEVIMRVQGEEWSLRGRRQWPGRAACCVEEIACPNSTQTKCDISKQQFRKERDRAQVKHETTIKSSSRSSLLVSCRLVSNTRVQSKSLICLHVNPRTTAIYIWVYC